MNTLRCRPLASVCALCSNARRRDVAEVRQHIIVVLARVQRHVEPAEIPQGERCSGGTLRVNVHNRWLRGLLCRRRKQTGKGEG